MYQRWPISKGPSEFDCCSKIKKQQLTARVLLLLLLIISDSRSCKSEKLASEEPLQLPLQHSHVQTTELDFVRKIIYVFPSKRKTSAGVREDYFWFPTKIGLPDPILVKISFLSTNTKMSYFYGSNLVHSRTCQRGLLCLSAPTRW